MNRRHTIICACTAPFLTATVVFAQSGDPTVFSLPPECTPLRTVQSRDCSVDHFFTCSTDAAGYQRRATFIEEGLVYIGTIDAETQWIESIRFRANTRETLVPNPTDPASLSELIATGMDSYDFETVTDTGIVTRFVGDDRFIGETVEIDGVQLERTAYQITAFNEDGEELWRSAGNEYVQVDWRTFLGGTGVTVTSSDEFEDDQRPVEFIFPGEAGFFSTKPKFGCGAMLSSYSLFEGDF